MWSISCGPLIGSPESPEPEVSGPGWLLLAQVDVDRAGVDLVRPVDRGLGDEADLLRLLGGEALLDHLVGDLLDRLAAAEGFARRHRNGEDRLQLLDLQVV